MAIGPGRHAAFTFSAGNSRVVIGAIEACRGCSAFLWEQGFCEDRRSYERHFSKWCHAHWREAIWRGRAGERAATGITECLNELGFESGRMKTGTPPRLDGRSLDYEQFEVQQGDEQPAGFSFMRQPLPKKQRCCWIANTSEEVHDVLRSGFDRSPMFNGAIKSSGPRYCPSIEDKIDRFADKNSHQLFVEPEGWNTVEVYLNGFSTSLPQEVQEEALRKIKGFENARFFRPGYAIEYDYFPPTQLTHSLETKSVEGLFFAGQINGTTGYEEAAGQGLMAGLNAARKVQGQDAVVLRRTRHTSVF